MSPASARPRTTTVAPILRNFGVIRVCGAELRLSGYRNPVQFFQHPVNGRDRKSHYVRVRALDAIDEAGGAPLDGVRTRLPLRLACRNVPLHFFCTEGQNVYPG